MKTVTKPPGELTEDSRKSLPLYPIGIVAELIGATEQTLRLYEKHTLIKPARRGKNRYYSENDITWLKCLRDLIHRKKISIEGIKKLLDYAPCWEITDCTDERKKDCLAYIDRTKPCWEINRRICNREAGKVCEECIVYLSKTRGRKGTKKSPVPA